MFNRIILQSSNISSQFSVTKESVGYAVWNMGETRFKTEYSIFEQIDFKNYQIYVSMQTSFTSLQHEVGYFE